MLENKKKRYKQAYAELNEIFKLLTIEEINKIPKQFILNVQNEMDKDYVCQLYKDKTILEQNLMPETKALIIEIYERYLCSEKEVWKQYDKICLNTIEEEKKKKYNPSDIFKSNQNSLDTKEISPETSIINYKKETFFVKIINKLKNILKR